ncbi:MAG: hypothetical protein KJZ75_12525 [Hyphomonadaceae bacterium]|nr:hypothetical protein [Hyphomonadaceae bacterium]
MVSNESVIVAPIGRMVAGGPAEFAGRWAAFDQTDWPAAGAFGRICGERSGFAVTAPMLMRVCPPTCCDVDASAAPDSANLNPN